MNLCRRSWVRCCGLFALVMGILVPMPAIANTTTDEIGFSPDHVFSGVVEGEHFDLMTGNVALSIPIGPEYQVHPLLRYQLKLHYNAQVWQHECAGLAANETCTGEVRTSSTYGLGIKVHFGRIWKDANDIANIYRYETPSGGSRVFCDAEAGGIPCPGDPLSKENTADAGAVNPVYDDVGDTWSVALEDGTKVIFGHKATSANKHVAGWYATEIQAPGNSSRYVRVVYSGADDTIDRIEDSSGRTIEFTYFPNSIEITVPTFSGQSAIAASSTSTYTLHLSSGTATDPADYSGTSVSYLDRVDLPELDPLQGESYTFAYDAYGSLDSWTTPTGTLLEYHKRRYASGPGRPYQLDVYARELTADGETRQWTYTRFGDSITDLSAPMQEAKINYSNPYSVRVLDPANNLTVYGFHSTNFGIDDEDCKNRECPRGERDGLLYAVDVYAGSEANTSRLVRSTRHEYIFDSADYLDTREGDEGFTPPTAYRMWRNVRITATETTIPGGTGVPSKTTRTEYSDWQIGSGSPMPETVRELIDGSLYRTTKTTREDGARCNNLWTTRQVLDASGNSVSYTEKQARNCSQDNCVVRRVAGAPGGQPLTDCAAVSSSFLSDGDNATRYNYNASGFTTSVEQIGGDGDDGDKTYTTIYTHNADGVVESKKFGALSWKATDRDIDGNTGLPYASRDPGGIETTYAWDDLGRLTTINPAGTAEYATRIFYPSVRETVVHRADGLVSTPPAIDAVGDFMQSRYHYDESGRVVRTERRNLESSYEYQEVEYDVAGNVERESVWVKAGTDPLLIDWTSYDYGTYTNPKYGQDPSEPEYLLDPLGRPASVTAPDGATVSYEYIGPRNKITLHGIATDFSAGSFGTIDATTVQDHDALGRLVAVDSPGGGADASYTYDTLDRLTRVELVDPAAPGDVQIRIFAYDPLGRLRSATHPESGNTTYDSYDARGELVRHTDASLTSFFRKYDEAGRLVGLYQGADATGLKLADYEFDAVADNGEGRLTRVQSYEIDDGAPTLVSDRRYTYGSGSTTCADDPYGEGFAGLNGRLREVTETLYPWGETLTTRMCQNEWGSPHLLLYPDVEPTSRTRRAKLSYKYENGVLWEIHDYNRSFQVLRQIDYDANGAPTWIQRGNYANTTIQRDSQGRPLNIDVALPESAPSPPYRPYLNSVTGCGGSQGDIVNFEYCGPGPGANDPPTPQYWGTGAYEYDGAGNIQKIGGSHYFYDALNRLDRAEVFHDTSNTLYEMDYTYDGFGNMTYRSKTPSSTQTAQTSTFNVDWATNRLVSGDFVTPNGFRTDAYAFDANGNMIQDGGRSLVFDDRNRLREVWEAGERLGRYSYDASGYRVRVLEDEFEIYYVRDGSGSVLSEFKRRSDATTGPVWDKDYLHALGRSVMLIKNQAPEAPTNAEATNVTATSLNLDWELSQEIDLAGTDITRKYQQSAGGPIITTQFSVTCCTDYVDTYGVTATSETKIEYWLYARDMAGNQSTEPAVIVVRPLGQPPDAPTNLVGAPTDRAAQLSWDAVTDDDLRGYIVRRKAPGEQSFSDLNAATPIAGTAYLDGGLINGQTYTYCVNSVDTSGRTSASCSNEVSVTPYDNVPPAVPQNVTIRRADTADTLELSWQKVTDQDLAEYRVYRSTVSGTAGALHATVAPGSSFEVVYEDTSATAGSRYFYRVTSADNSGNESAYEAEVSERPRSSIVGVPKLTAASFAINDESNNNASHADCDLTFRDDDEIVVNLQWDPETSGAVDGYIVYRRETGQSELVRAVTLPSTDTTWQDDTLNGEWSVEYYIVGYETNGTEEDESAIHAEGKITAVDAFDTAVEELRIDEPAVTSGPWNERSKSVTLSWNRVPESQLLGYHIYRRCEFGWATLGGYETFLSPDYCDGGWVRITEEPVIGQTTFVDASLPGLGGSWAYTVIPEAKNGTDGPAGVLIKKATRLGFGAYSANCEKASSIRQRLLYYTGVSDSEDTPASTIRDQFDNRVEAPFDGDPTGPPPAAERAWFYNWLGQYRYGIGTSYVSMRAAGIAGDFGVTATPSDGAPMAFRWPSDIVGYHVEMAGSPDGPWERITRFPVPLGGSEYHVQVPGILTGTDETDPKDYYPDLGCTRFRVVMVDEDGMESDPTLVDALGGADAVMHPDASCPQTPEAPQSLVATRADPATSDILLTWDPVPGATEYWVFRRKLDDGVFGNFFYPTAVVTGTSYTETGTGLANDPTTCPYGFPDACGDAYESALQVYYVRAKGTGIGLSPRSAMVFIDPTDPVSSSLEPAPVIDNPLGTPEEHEKGGRVYLASLRLPPQSVVTVEGDTCPLDGDRSVLTAVVPDDESANYAVLGSAADPNFELIDLFADHLGSTRVVANDNGLVLAKNTFLPFGELLFPGDAWNTHLFTGHERDGGTGLDYMFARYYSDSLGRFLSKDPVNGFAEDPQSWNRYAYVRNNPLIIRDPTGEFWDYVVDAIGIGYDVYNLWNEPSWGNAGILAGDVVLGIIPFIPNTGAVRLGFKLLSKGDDALDAIKGARAAGVSEDVLEKGGKWLRQFDEGVGVIKADNGDTILTGVKRGGDGQSATRWYKRVGPDGETKTLWHDNYKDGKFTGRKHKDVEGQDAKEVDFPEPSKGSAEGGPNQTVFDPQTGQKGSCGYLCR